MEKRPNYPRFSEDVDHCTRQLQALKAENKRIYILADADNTAAFYSMAPVSCAAHELGFDVFALFKNKGEFYKNLLKLWFCYHSFENPSTLPDLKKDIRQKALAAFITEADKKAKGEIEQLFAMPVLFLIAQQKGFLCLTKAQMISGKVFEQLMAKTDLEKLRLAHTKTKPAFLAYQTRWFQPHQTKLLETTCRKIWTEVYTLQRTEQVGIGFELIPVRKRMTLPLLDYLDSYAIVQAMKNTCPSTNISLSSSSSRDSVLDSPEKTSELGATLLGCELDKNIAEPVFQKYKAMAFVLGFFPMKTNDAVFGIHGKGYAGRHIFGDYIGYPTLNRKSRWKTPGGILYKFSWYPQAKHESRDPVCRVGFTETLPIDVFIQSCNVDWNKMRKDNQKLMDAINSSDSICVASATSNFIVQLINEKTGKRRYPKPSGADVQTKINEQTLKETGLRTGNMANLPGGEAFLTPEYIEGTFYGDVVISIDQSYRLDEKNPLCVQCTKDGYTVLGGEKKIISTLNKKKKDAYKTILLMEKHESAPKEVIALAKKNFNKIGEFAINTNPHAQLCDYLIVNEKIAGMIHIALGAGFDEDRHTEYHYDIVINAKKQKLDIYGVKKIQKGNKTTEKKIWMLKQGRFVL
ncbi:MAG: hypothetical protein V1743_01690 [Nanoarchaeota archaeon]